MCVTHISFAEAIVVHIINLCVSYIFILFAKAIFVYVINLF